LIHHPCRNDDGGLVVIHRPSTPTASEYWEQPGALATAVPVCGMPASLNGVALTPAMTAPGAGKAVDEPPFILPPGMKAAAGAVVVEDDGRVWLVSPTNGFGGYSATFPKGRVDAGGTLQHTAIREVFEESGLTVRLEAHLIDVRRTQTYTRYYIARRIGGCPSRMGWETQAVHLVPAGRLEDVAAHPNDAAIIRALRDWMKAQR
jgi:8-oxo-dGTP pyrophosphatase MutT (NUDIX family)